jgi:hypothetical protein
MVLTKIITKSFLKTGITNAPAGNEVDMLWVEDKNVDARGVSETTPESSSEDNT